MSGSDRDDSTGIFKEQKTRVRSKKLQVQMSSGKIYGPYTRDEVLDFIASKRIRGEEKILLEGEMQWKAIASDPEFFDAIHAVISGIEYKRKPMPEEATSHSGFSNSEESTQLSKDRTRTEYLPNFGGDTENKTKLSKPISHNIVAPQKTAEPTLEEVFRDNVSSKTSENIKDKVPASKPQNKKRILYAVVALVITLLWLQGQQTTKQNIQAWGVAALQQRVVAQNYSRSLVDVLSKLNLEQLRLPNDLKREPLKQHFQFNLNARVAVLRMSKVLEDTQNPQNSSGAFWQQLSIDLYLLSLRVQVLDVQMGKDLQNRALRLIEELKQRSLWSDEEQLLLDLLVAHSTGNWEKIISEAAFSSYPIAGWLKSDANWWKSWGEAKFRKAPPENTGTLSADLEIISKAKDTFIEDDPEIATWLLQLAGVDPESPYLWFLSAQINWRKSKNVRVDAAYRDFMVGLGSLALYPPAIQISYWEQFSEFLKSYARAETHKNAVNNVDLLSRGNIAIEKSGTTWWDLQATGLDVQSVGNEILQRSSRGMLNARDRAVLLVLGHALSKAEEFLFIVGTHYCFEEQWDEADAIFGEMLLRNPQSKNAYFGKIWVLSKQFKFLEAQDEYSKLQRYSLGDNSHLRSKGLIYYLGREYAEAKNIFEGYLKQNPNDAWALYFSANSYVHQKDFLGCIKFANLARVQGRGELAFRSELLFHECRVRSNVDFKASLDQLRRMIEETPDSLPLRILFVELMNESGFHNEAIHLLEESLKYFPFSAKLKITAGKLYDGQGVLGKSIDYYTQAAQLAPNMAEPWVRMAKVLENQGKHLEAARNYEMAARVQPTYPEVYLYGARAFQKAGRVAEAANMYGKELELRPEAMSTFVEAAEFFLKNNKPQEVPVIYRKFHGAFQDDPRALVRLAQAYNVMGDLANAKSFASRAVAGDPENPFINFVLANILDRAGEYQMAKRYYQIYLQLNPQASDGPELQDRMSRPPYSN